MSTGFLQLACFCRCILKRQVKSALVELKLNEYEIYFYRSCFSPLYKMHKQAKEARILARQVILHVYDLIYWCSFYLSWEWSILNEVYLNVVISVSFLVVDHTFVEQKLCVTSLRETMGSAVILVSQCRKVCRAYYMCVIWSVHIVGLY